MLIDKISDDLSDKKLLSSWLEFIINDDWKNVRHLLIYVALLDPNEPFPNDILLDPAADAFGIQEKALQELYNRGLLESIDENWSGPHRLIPALMNEISEDEIQEVSQAFALRLAERVNECTSSGNPQRIVSWRMQLSWLTKRLLCLEEPTGVALANALGQHFDQMAEWALAEHWYRKGLELAERCGSVSLTTSALLGNLAQVLQATNHLEEAEVLLNRALVLDESQLGPSHPKVAIHLNNLAALFHHTNRVAEAEACTRRALSIDEACYGSEHLHVARDLNNLAALQMSIGRLEEAETMLHRAIGIEESQLGEQHPLLANSLNNLAMLQQAMGRLDEAEAGMVRVMRIKEVCFGVDHPEIAIAKNNLAMLLQETNRFSEAEALMEHVVTICINTYGKEHPETAMSLNNFAMLLAGTGRIAEALPMLQRAISLFHASLGPDHPHSQVAARNCALLLESPDGMTVAE